MGRFISKFFFSVLCIACLLAWTGGNVNAAAQANNLPILTDDVATGRITLENSVIKGVWQYEALASGNYNQGGGSLYELYYKPNDPNAERNLVAFNNMPGWGNGQSTALWVGIGGVGATTMYASDAAPAQNQSYNFADVLGDNNLSGTLESHSAVMDQNGNALISFSFRVHNQSTGKDWYRVVKNWTVEPNGAIHLRIDWTILSSGYFAEPALRTGWSYSVGWDQFVKYGRDWLNPSQPKYLLGSSGISGVTCNCWDYLNRFVPDWYSLTGSSIAPTVTMAPDNNGLGFSATGSYLLGASVWGSPANPVQEECTIKNNYTAAHLINWMAAWGGSPPVGARYARLDAGRNWSDSYRIDMSQGPPASAPVISAVNVTRLDGNNARITWNTDQPSDSTVEASTNCNGGGPWTVAGRDQGQTTSHTLDVAGLTPGQTYMVRVTSNNSTGDRSVSSGFNLASSSTAPVGLNLALNVVSVSWSSYSDYASGKLTVGYRIDNKGSANAASVTITSAAQTHNVVNTTPLPMNLGNLSAGGSSQFNILYQVPGGVSQFHASLHCTAIDQNGVLVSFP